MDDQMKQIVSALKPLFDHIQTQMNEQFNAMNERFNVMDERFQSIDGRFQSIDGRFQSIDGRFQSMDGRFQSIDERFDRVEAELADVKNTGRRTAAVVAKLQEDVTDIKLRMATRRDIAEQNGRMSAIATEIENSRKERILAEKSYMRHESRLDDRQARLSRLETRRRS